MNAWVLLLALAGLWVGVLAVFGRPLLARWREPVLRSPLLVIESDDWGAGPPEQAELLGRLTKLLHSMPDASGRPALMTLGIIMEVPDGERIAATAGTRYFACTLADVPQAGVLSALKEGVHMGVLVPQLHGQAHYWPPAVMATAQHDSDVASWLGSGRPARTEDLPSHLQSRWVDASILPSQALSPAVVDAAVADEAENFRILFGESPRVAVATTFVWNDVVESAWRKVGVEVVITPGVRMTCRGEDGKPAGADRVMLTGEWSSAGQIYLVRDVYFEPALGHPPSRLVEGLVKKTRQGRACLVETHRFNFLDAPEASLAMLAEGLAAARVRYPDLRYLTPAELVQAILQRDPVWIEQAVSRRFAAWRARLAEIPRFPRVARLVGLGWLLI